MAIDGTAERIAHVLHGPSLVFVVQPGRPKLIIRRIIMLTRIMIVTIIMDTNDCSLARTNSYR